MYTLKMTLKKEIKGEPVPMETSVSPIAEPHQNSERIFGYPILPQSPPQHFHRFSTPVLSRDAFFKKKDFQYGPDLHLLSPEPSSTSAMTTKSSPESEKSSLTMSPQLLPPSPVRSSASQINIPASPAHAVLNTIESAKTKTNFSIEEILKPSFGAKTTPQPEEQNEALVLRKPGDLRPSRNECHKHREDLDQVHMVHDHQRSFQKVSHNKDKSGFNSYSHSHCSPERDCDSTGRDSDSRSSSVCERLTETYSDYNIPGHETSDYKDIFFSLLRYPYSVPTFYRSASNPFLYGLDLGLFRDHFFQGVRPTTGWPSLHNNIYQKFYNEECHSESRSTDAFKSTSWKTSDFSSFNHCKSDAESIPNETENLKESIMTTTALNSTTSNKKGTLKTKKDSVHVNGQPTVKVETKPLGGGQKSNITITTTSSNNSIPNNSDKSGQKNGNENNKNEKEQFQWPAWVYCTRYSDRPSSGPRYRKPRQKILSDNDKRPRTAFSSEQLRRLKQEFDACPYLSESRRQRLSADLGLNESQVKIWFQNKRAKLKKGAGAKNTLAQRLMEEGLYNHSTVVVEEESTDNCAGL